MRIAFRLALAGAAVVMMGSTPARGTLHISSHLPQAAQVVIDGHQALRAPATGEVSVPLTAGRHSVRVNARGVGYSTVFNATPETLFQHGGRGYWCINLLAGSIQVYSRAECAEDVLDRG
jgi:hypothetical protein